MSKLGEALLYKLTQTYRSEWDHGDPKVKATIGTDDYNLSYSFVQLFNKIKNGLGVNVYGMNVLEIGCGHGGICCFAAMNGAKSVVGIDLSDSALVSSKNIQARIESDLNIRLPLDFRYMSAEKLDFPDGSMDIIIADNVFEHVNSLEEVFAECRRVLKKGGLIVVPNFPSIYSKFGPHVKYGIKLPWVNVFFRERTVVKVMHRLAKTDEKMFEFYPGLRQNAKTFQECRAYRDLNYITNQKFRKAAESGQFSIDYMYVNRPLFGMAAFKLLPFLKWSTLGDVISYGTTAILKKN